jgi:hypothetical protein
MLLKERNKAGEEVEEDVSSYSMSLRKLDFIGN